MIHDVNFGRSCLRGGSLIYTRRPIEIVYIPLNVGEAAAVERIQIVSEVALERHLQETRVREHRVVVRADVARGGGRSSCRRQCQTRVAGQGEGSGADVISSVQFAWWLGETSVVTIEC